MIAPSRTCGPRFDAPAPLLAITRAAAAKPLAEVLHVLPRVGPDVDDRHTIRRDAAGQHLAPGPSVWGEPQVTHGFRPPWQRAALRARRATWVGKGWRQAAFAYRPHVVGRGRGGGAGSGTSIGSDCHVVHIVRVGPT